MTHRLTPAIWGRMLPMLDGQIGNVHYWPCLLLLLLSLLPATTGRLVATESDATRTIAAILIEFVHTCAPFQRDALEAIVNNPAVTAQERLLAQALLHVQHTPSPDDKPQLLALVQDKLAKAAHRTIATVIYNLVHTATDADKEQLNRWKD